MFSFARPDVTVMGPINIADGIGNLAYKCLYQLKDHLSIGLVLSNKPKMQNVETCDLKFLKKAQRKPLGKVIFFTELMWNNNKNLAARYLKGPKNEREIRIAYTMLEGSAIPSEWVYLLNHYFDAALVPDLYLVEVYKNCGVTIPLFVLPVGLNLKEHLRAPLKSSKNTPFVFGNLASCGDRKNHVTLIEAFRRAFGSTKEVLLKINSRYASSSKYAKIVKTAAWSPYPPNIFFSLLALNEREYFELLHSFDCLVYPSKGEGFSQQPREAMALGIPVILSNNTAHQTICQTGLVTSVESDIELKAYYPSMNQPCGVNYSCTIDDLAQTMLDLYNNYEEHLKKGVEARNWAAQFQIENFTPLYLSLFKPKEVILGGQDHITSTALYTSCLKLAEKYALVLNTPIRKACLSQNALLMQPC